MEVLVGIPQVISPKGMPAITMEKSNGSRIQFEAMTIGNTTVEVSKINTINITASIASNTFTIALSPISIQEREKEGKIQPRER